ncbi:MAG: ribosomal protein S18-alanine N-acetyltransferase [Clostridia bacterium]|nr:ribosomal protein S18-alanine N-acetyltransferase [Clostridia bacterium]
MRIIDMCDAHLPDILKVEQESFFHPWTESMFREEMAGNFSVYRVAEADGKAVGYMGMWILADEGHITNVAVGKAYRRQGIGGALIDDFIALAIEKNLCLMTLEVRESNENAISLYAAKGFVPVGRRKKYYENTEDAILMTKFFDTEG